MKVLVTGASGFVGRALRPALEAAGHGVVPVGRAETGDIGPETDWRPHLGGVEAVVHLAARVHMMPDPAPDPLSAHRRINRDATLRLAEQAAECGIRRFVHFSSVKVNGEGRATPYTAAHTPEPRDPYGIAKQEAEAGLRAIAATDAFSLTVLRPPVVYGPGVKGNILRLFRLVESGLPLPLGAVGNRRSLIAVANLTDAARWALDGPPGTYLPSDRDDVSTPELVRRIARAMGRPARLLPVPEPLLRLAGRATGRSDVIGRLCDSLTVDGKLPDWTPPTGMQEALAATAEWYRSRRL